jgi:hypothetical protein
MAQYNLGVAHNYGHGVPEDHSLAYFWMALSAIGSTGEDCVSIAESKDEIATIFSPLLAPIMNQQVERGTVSGTTWQ